ncbi:LON peptidase substrate-binding domain-containing protein [Dongshaea marina]|uniref:LON peptidase substrate-binding domain-containing protein n=1 Tax=Dongshaea marina TaxID=2047966 RepID=UPI000D3E3CF1|nr:LON peptidase substrate-binding domain-containing protein [Dongshaea marina]
MERSSLPLLRITCHLLPGGILPLRLSDPVQVELCKAALTQDGLIALGFIDEQQKRSNLTPDSMHGIGTRAEIIDFFLTPDQTLSITVKGIDRFKFKQVREARDGLEWADIDPLPNWQDQLLDGEEQVLASMLEDIYLSYPELSELHPQKALDDAAWISQRWLELLPISDSEKQMLLEHSSCTPVVAYLQQMLSQSTMSCH